ncbi:hypothetical protein [Labrys wisconsinensis]|uniref:Prevent host death protein, Phd antitoxin n=1 Tax=Labrys wisconsinensis TaxID=425677 RepID=A0ABU0J7J6_9HYPH|nr:hypothetical protein [Labrys wisconsinensis]MDQ0470246.1 hypothetical protein [Labrys wisconsinensis]
MSAETIDHVTLTRLVEAGAVRSTRVVGQDGGWAVRIGYGTAERALAAQRSHRVRLFKRFETLASYLKGVGISRFDVDVTDYASEAVKTRARPDRAEALRRVHEAAAYDRWFREEVGKAVREADDPSTEWIPHEVIKQDIAQQRAELQARIKREAK